jgi:hypothetical protein
LNFILDENIITSAAKVEDVKGNMNADCGILTSEVLKKCDIVHCTTELWDGYMDKIKVIGKRNLAAGYTLKILSHAIRSVICAFHNNMYH